MGVNTVGMTVTSRDSITFLASRSRETACLVIDTGQTHCEIQLGRAPVEALRDQLPDVLTALDRWAAEQAGSRKAEITAKRATDAAARALDQAVAAEAAGAHDLAIELRAAATDLTAKINAADAAAQTFGDATEEVDEATDRLIYTTTEARRLDA